MCIVTGIMFVVLVSKIAVNCLELFRDRRWFLRTSPFLLLLLLLLCLLSFSSSSLPSVFLLALVLSRSNRWEQFVRSRRQLFSRFFFRLFLQLPKDAYCRQFLGRQEVPEDPGRFRSPVGDTNNPGWGNDDIHGNVVLCECPAPGHIVLVFDDLAVVHGRYHQAFLGVQISLGRQNSPLQLGKALALSHACSGSGAHSGAADNHQVYRILLVQSDRGSVFDNSLAVGALFDLDQRGQFLHFDGRKESGSQSRLGCQQHLFLLQHEMSHGSLWSVRVDLDYGGRFEFGELAQSSRCPIRVDKVRDAMVHRPGESSNIVFFHVIPDSFPEFPFPR
mmetsp:Transcript_7072/g.13903  ORF Transcript_7072/g.13903 Transcript_7072/m.13903 type:complete len:333 (-) Transcript_7072:401-1399(-)